LLDESEFERFGAGRLRSVRLRKSQLSLFRLFISVMGIVGDKPTSAAFCLLLNATHEQQNDQNQHD
jgi:hypothetical protein